MKSLPPRKLLWVAWTFEGLALFPPVMWYLDNHWPSWAQQNPLVYYIFAPFALVYWVMQGLAALFCVPLGIAACAVILSPDIRTRTKFLVGIVGVIAYLSLLHWAKVAKYTG